MQVSSNTKNFPESIDVPDAFRAPIASSSDGATPSSSINWRLHSAERLRPLWQVIALSFCVQPNRAAIASASENGNFHEQYDERRRYLGRKLVTKRQPGYVTYFPLHPHTPRKSTASANLIVDVLDCIDALKAGYEDLPEEFLALAHALSKIPPPSALSDGAEAASIPLIEDSVHAKAKKDQSKRHVSVEMASLYLLVNAMAKGGYSLPEAAEPADRMRIAEDILEDVIKSTNPRSLHGISTVASVLKKLVEAEKLARGNGQ